MHCQALAWIYFRLVPSLLFFTLPSDILVPEDMHTSCTSLLMYLMNAILMHNHNLITHESTIVFTTICHLARKVITYRTLQ